MRKVFLDELPKKKTKIDWLKSIGHKVKFIYDDIEDEVEIADYKKKERNLVIKYKEIESFEIYTSDFRGCKLKTLLGLKQKEYKYNIGDIIEDKLILKQIRMSNGLNKTCKGYLVKCVHDGYEWETTEYNLIKGKDCSVCCNKIVATGVNDIATTHPHLVKYFVNIEDAKTNTFSCLNEVDMICPNCGFEKTRKIDGLSRVGFQCPCCGDGISYPEKYLFSLLEQLNIDFLPQLTKTTFKWCNNFKYDFYIPSLNCIIETHGKQHYEGSFKEIGGRTLDEEQENDRLKKELALKNGIKEENYIVIDCRKSRLEYIKNSISSSELAKLFNLLKINWLQCHEYACSSRVKEASDLWNKGIHNTKEIGIIMKINYNSICKYLKQATELNWCNYNPQEERIKTNRIRTMRKVICLNNNEVFESLVDACSANNIKNYTNIIACCKGKQKSAGKNIITGESLKWMYYDEYLKLKGI